MTRAPAPLFEGVVFTDLDGTLLDHETYEHAAALPALKALAARRIPVVLCSSKTRAEIMEIQSVLGIRGPFIPENGGAVLLAGHGELEPVFPERLGALPAKVFGTSYDELRKALGEFRGHFGAKVRGFGDATVADVQAWTGLARGQAERARDRDFDEPFVWEPEPTADEVEAAERWLGDRGLRLTRGGRFWHLTGDNDKGRAVGWLTGAIADRGGVRPHTLALGDSENDLPMLAAVDRGVLVARPGGRHLLPRPAGVFTVEGIGPVGWNRAVLEWLEELGNRGERSEEESHE